MQHLTREIKEGISPDSSRKQCNKVQPYQRKNR